MKLTLLRPEGFCFRVSTEDPSSNLFISWPTAFAHAYHHGCKFRNDAKHETVRAGPRVSGFAYLPRIHRLTCLYHGQRRLHMHITMVANFETVGNKRSFFPYTRTPVHGSPYTPVHAFKRLLTARAR